VHLQILSSGSGGNCALIRAGELRVLVDAGLGRVDMEARLERAGVPPPMTARPGIDHVLVTHGHLDHARSAGMISRKYRARLHCAEALMSNASIRRAREMATLSIGNTRDLDDGESLRITPVALPHDADPTVAFKVEHGERCVVILTDMGRPDEHVARALHDAHVLVLEFNHDRAMLDGGPYPAPLKKRVGGDRGHLSNDQACEMLLRMLGPRTHTLVLAHLSETNNTPQIALDCARRALESRGLAHLRVLVASQHEVGENLSV
jgi:phosphoribosyl 1,2-cyclic phosphodiesterase